MRQKYVISRDSAKNKLKIREYAFKRAKTKCYANNVRDGSVWLKPTILKTKKKLTQSDKVN